MTPVFKTGMLAILLWLSTATSADQQLDTLKHISAAGAPFLTLKMLDQAQPGLDQDLYQWILWEQERYRILSQWDQWNELLIRIEGLPKDLPDPFLHQAATYRVKAYLALGQNQTARKILRDLLWGVDAGSSGEYRQWRKLMVETYLNDQRVDDARVAMLRLQQDFDMDDKDWIMLRARVLMQTGRFDEVIALLQSRIDWQSLGMKLLAEYRNRLHSADTLWDLTQKRLELVADDTDQRASFWTLAVIAGRDISAVKHVVALENRLKIDSKDHFALYPISADQLWSAYMEYAELVGNRSELLKGDDPSWFYLAQNSIKMTPIKARSLLAYLIINSPSEDMRKQAGSTFLQTLDLENEEHQFLLDQLFNRSQRFQDAALIPIAIRFQLVDLALKKADIVKATRLMSGLHTIPENTRRMDWLLRQSRVLLMGDMIEQGSSVIGQLIAEYREPTRDDTDHILQVLFDMQTIGADEQAITHFRSLLKLPIDAQQRREILFWTADSFKALKQYERAALLYLQSAMFTGPDSMDPWARTSRFNAAESLQKAGLVDDARRIFQGLLAVTSEPGRRSVLRHKIQQLWLTQSTE